MTPGVLVIIDTTNAMSPDYANSLVAPLLIYSTLQHLQGLSIKPRRKIFLITKMQLKITSASITRQTRLLTDWHMDRKRQTYTVPHTHKYLESYVLQSSINYIHSLPYLKSAAAAKPVSPHFPRGKVLTN